MSLKLEEFVKVILDWVHIPESAQRLMSRIKIPLTYVLALIVLGTWIYEPFDSGKPETTQHVRVNNTQIGSGIVFNTLNTGTQKSQQAGHHSTLIAGNVEIINYYGPAPQSTNAPPYDTHLPNFASPKPIINGSIPKPGNNYAKGDLPEKPCAGILGNYNIDDDTQQGQAWEFLEKRLVEMEDPNSLDMRLIEEARDEWNRGHSHEAFVKFNVALSCPNIAFDKYTHLTWQKSPNCDSHKWTDAKDYCVALTMAGHNDWRLPTEQELKTMLKRKSISPLNDVFGADCPFPDSYWSSSLEGTKYALLVDQKSALVHKRPISDKDYGYVWCVHN
jgi:Protein of unknown function (DUF1566)